jgi:hypothetical protein
MAELSSPILGMQVRRNVIPANAILGRPEQQAPGPDPQTALALRRNQIAIQSVNNSLTGVSNQIAVLSNSLRTISTQIQQSSALEQAKQVEENKQQRILAEQRLREGKEGLLERKIQTALSKPLQKVGGAAQKSLFSLGRFFQILLLGTLGNRILRVVGDLSSEGKLSLGNLFEKIKTDLAIAGAIFVGLNGGFLLALRTLTGLTARLGGFALRNLLLRPINLVFSLAAGALASLAQKLRGVPPVPAPPPKPPKTPTGGPTGGPTPNPTRGGLRGTLGNLARGTRNVAILNALLGQNFDQSLVSGVGGALGGLAMAPIPIPGARIAGFMLGSSFFGDMYSKSGISIPFLNQNLNDLGIPDLGDGARFLFERLTKSEADLQADQQKANTLIVNGSNNGGGVTEVPSSGGSGTGNTIINVSSGNGDNPYMLHSLIQYNIGGMGI